MKICSKCKELKPMDNFHNDISKRDKKHSQCKSCHSNRIKLKRKTNIEWVRAERIKSKEYRINNSEQFKKTIRNSTLKKKYGINIEQYNEIFKNQGYVCAICGSDKPRGYGRMCVDHNHLTGKIRGILCQPCNTSIGKMMENPNLIRKLALYVESDGFHNVK